MKQLTCEMCGSTNLIKQDGVFICQNCGTKYSVEEAKKMMIEGTVNVQGTVQVDNSNDVSKFLANARRAKEKEDWEETEKYYNLVEQYDPDNIEAIFYSAYGKAKETLLIEDVFKRQDAFNVLKNCISVIDDHYKVERAEENKSAILSMAADIGKMITSSFVVTTRTTTYGGIIGVSVTKDNSAKTYPLFAALLDGFRESIHNIAKVDDQVYLHETLKNLFTVAKSVNWVPDTKTKMLSIFDKWIDEEEVALDKVKKERIEEYWNSHSEEKNKLEEEKEKLTNEIEHVDQRISQLPEKKDIDVIEEKIKAKIDEKDSLGLFKGKEKKKIQEEIDVLDKELEQKKGKFSEASAKYIEKKKVAEDRISEIDNEFIKDR